MLMQISQSCAPSIHTTVKEGNYNQLKNPDTIPSHLLMALFHKDQTVQLIGKLHSDMHVYAK